MSDANRFLLVGVGGAGGRIANQVAQRTGGRLRAAAIDTDFADVAQQGLCQQVRIGHSRFDGLGSGGNATLARMAADEDADALRKLFLDARLAIVTAGLGGGTASGVTPAVLRVAREMNVRTLVFATLPFGFEGDERRALAKRTLPQLDAGGDVVTLFENDALCADATERPMTEALQCAAETLAAGMTLLWLLTTQPGYIRLDFATLLNLLQYGRGRASFAFAQARGPHRFEEALSELLDHPGRGMRRSLPGAPALLLGILAGEDLRLKEIGDTVSRLRMELDAECDLRMGTVLLPRDAQSFSLAVLVFHSWVGTTDDRAPEAASREPLDAAASDALTTLPRAPARTVRNGSAGKAASAAGERFGSTLSAVYEGEELDVPTYLRRKLPIHVQ